MIRAIDLERRKVDDFCGRCGQWTFYDAVKRVNEGMSSGVGGAVGRSPDKHIRKIGVIGWAREEGRSG